MKLLFLVFMHVLMLPYQVFTKAQIPIDLCCQKSDVDKL